MIKNFVFDIGGVLLEYDPNKYLDKLDIPQKERVVLNDIIFRDKMWSKCLKGIVTHEELLKYLVNNNLQYSAQIQDILSYDNLKFMLPPKNDTIEYLKKLKQNGYKIYILSNITKQTYEYIKNSFDFLEIVDGAVYSCFEQVSKPNKEIFLKLIDRYRLNVNESVFIDDTKRNIEAAQLLGFKTVLFDKIEDLESINLK